MIGRRIFSCLNVQLFNENPAIEDKWLRTPSHVHVVHIADVEVVGRAAGVGVHEPRAVVALDPPHNCSHRRKAAAQSERSLRSGQLRAPLEVLKSCIMSCSLNVSPVAPTPIVTANRARQPSR